MSGPTLRARTWGVVLTASLTGTLALTACAGGSGQVDQTNGGNYRYVGATPKGHSIPENKRKTAGDATAPYLDSSKKFDLSAMKGRVVVLNYWASWCTPCRAETSGLESTYVATKAAGVSFIGVNVKDETGSAASFVRQNRITYPIVSDETAKTALNLGGVPTFSLPSTVVIDRQGKVAAVYSGPVQQGDLQPVLTALAREK